MKSLQTEYPESWPAAADSSLERFACEARVALAMKLFEMGRLASGQAAQLAGGAGARPPRRVAFLLSGPQWNVPAVAWDAAEISAAFKPLPS